MSALTRWEPVMTRWNPFKDLEDMEKRLSTYLGRPLFGPRPERKP